MKLTTENLIRRIKKAEGVQQLYKDLFEPAYELALPQKNLWTRFQHGARKMEKVFDSSGMTAINGFVNRIQSALTPSFVKWAELVAGPAIPKENRGEINKILEVVTDIIFSTINSSNFPVAAGEMYFNLAVGTGALLVLEGDDEKPIKFISVDVANLSIDEGDEGTITGIFRKHKLSARGVKSTWKDAKIPSDLAKIIEDEPGKEVTFDEVTYFDEEDKIWRYEVLWNKEAKIVENTFEVNPWVIVRWSKIPGEVFGRGPLLQALPDLKQLNKGKELQIRSAILNVFGAFTVMDDGITNVNTINIRPNALIPVTRNGGPNGPSIQKLDTTGNFQAQAFMFEELRQQVNILMLNKRLPPDAGPVRSATEIVERLKELQTDTGASFGRLIFEFIQPLLQRVIHILERKGIIQFGGGIKIDNLSVTTQLLSPLAKSQGLEDVNSIVQAGQIMDQLDPTGQMKLLSLDTENTGTYIAEKLGVSPSLIRSDNQKKEVIQAAAEASAAQQQPQQPQPTQ